MKIIKTITEVVLHPTDDGILSERATTIRLEDEGAGCFVTLEQSNGHGAGGKQRIAIDGEEIEPILEAARMLLAQPGVKEAA